MNSRVSHETRATEMQMADTRNSSDRERPEFDVVNMSDFRLPGGTSHSIAQEIAAQASAGLTTGLVHVASPMIRRPLPWSPPMRESTRLPNVAIVPPGQAVTTNLLVIRHPSSVRDTSRISASIIPRQVVVVANHAARDADGSENYDVREIDRSLRGLYGISPVWRPIGPVVRKTLREFASDIEIGEDWLNIITSDSAQVRRMGPTTPRPTLGRHSRPQPAKWPSSPQDIKNAYPMDTEFDVRILGGTKAAELVLKKRPSNWTVYEFGSRAPADFLSEIDFWVYFHHPHTLEAYGRAIMEALHAGCVAIIPEYLRTTFGDAAVYGSPEDVRAIVRRYAADADLFIAQSTRGQDFVRRMGADLHIQRLADLGVDVRPAVQEVKAYGSVPVVGPKRVVFLTSNGAGMGHLTRLLAIARASDPEKIEPLFVSLSQGVPVVGEQGFPFEYLASSGAMEMPAPEWNIYFLERMREVLRTMRPSALVFDGTVPYVGLMNLLKEADLLKVWIRRGMWKEGASGTSLGREKGFDLVIEPGEFAHSYDEGPTARRSGAAVVNPITVLATREILDRDLARVELGMSPDAKTVLLTLGAGNINDIGDLQDAVLEIFRSEHPGWQVFVTKPPIAESTGASSLNVLRTYPLARVARAFDFAISAAGYNSFHEWTSMQIPTLWVPNEATAVDDQVARGRWAQDQGTGLNMPDGMENELRGLIGRLVDDVERSKMQEQMSLLPASDGAEQAARLIEARLAQ